jgi:hypothetical protein
MKIAGWSVGLFNERLNQPQIKWEILGTRNDKHFYFCEETF